MTDHAVDDVRDRHLALVEEVARLKRRLTETALTETVPRCDYDLRGVALEAAVHQRDDAILKRLRLRELMVDVLDAAQGVVEHEAHVHEVHRWCASGCELCELAKALVNIERVSWSAPPGEQVPERGGK